MEVSVGFADRAKDGGADAADKSGNDSRDYSRGHIQGETPLGHIYVPEEGVELDNGIDGITVRYEKHPWIERFELDGIRAAKPRRTGVGTKTLKGFVKSLSTIYAPAFPEYNELQEQAGELARDDWERYFGKVIRHFSTAAEAPQFRKMAKKFIGFAENMWREGDQEALDIAMSVLVPGIRSSRTLGRMFSDVITDEFAEYLESH